MNNAAAASTLFLGHNGDWWDFWLMVSVVVLAPIAAGAIGLTTAGSIISHQREAEASRTALDRFKVETSGNVAVAHATGMKAGLSASNALAKLKDAEARIKEGEAKTADANARAAEANLRAAQLQTQLMPRRADFEKLTKGLAGQAQTPVEILFDRNVADAYPFATELFGDLRKLGWPAIIPERIPDEDPKGSDPSSANPEKLPKHFALGMQAWGISVLTKSDTEPKSLLNARDALADAIAFTTGEQTSCGTNEFVPAGTIRVLIGPRAM